MLELIDRLLLPRETWELARLNKIWEAFNEKKLTPEQTRRKLYRYSWKKQQDNVDILVRFTIALEGLTHKVPRLAE